MMNKVEKQKAKATSMRADTPIVISRRGKPDAFVSRD